MTDDRREMQDEYRARFSSMEDEILKTLAVVGEQLDWIDKRWLAIGRTHIQQGFMAAKRSLYEGKRVGDP